MKTLLSSNQTSCLPRSLNYDKEMTYIPKQGFPNEKLPPSHDLFKYNMYSNCCKSLGLGLQVYPLETLVRLIHYNYFPALLQETRKWISLSIQSMSFCQKSFIKGVTTMSQGLVPSVLYILLITELTYTTKKKVWSVSDFIKSQGVKFKGE